MQTPIHVMAGSKTNLSHQSDAKSLISHDENIVSAANNENYVATAAAHDENYLVRRDSDNYLVSSASAEPQYHPMIQHESQQSSRQHSDPASTSINQGLASPPYNDEEAEELFMGYEDEEEHHNNTETDPRNRSSQKRGMLFKASIAALILAVIVLTIALSVYFAKSNKSKSGATQPNVQQPIVPTLSPMIDVFEPETSTGTKTSSSPSSFSIDAPITYKPNYYQETYPSPFHAIKEEAPGHDSVPRPSSTNIKTLLPATSLSPEVPTSSSPFVSSPSIRTMVPSLSNSSVPANSVSDSPLSKSMIPSPSNSTMQLPESTPLSINITTPIPLSSATEVPYTSPPGSPAISIMPGMSESSFKPTATTITTTTPEEMLQSIISNAIYQGNVTGLSVDLLNQVPQQKALQWLATAEDASELIAALSDPVIADLVLAKFALVSLYYDKMAERGIGSSTWLNSADICSWDFITCKVYETNDYAATMKVRERWRKNQTFGSNTGVKLTTVSELNLGGQNLTGQLPPFLALLKDLEVLDVSKNILTGEIPSAIWSMSMLRELSLWKNDLSGTISPLVSGISSLEKLYLDSNNLDGTLPSELFSLQNLTSFSAFNNKLKGTIPTEIAKLTNLQTLWLSSNLLSGRIPAEIGGLRSLNNLYLDDNYFIGSIPETIMNCSQLADVRLNTNFFSGSVTSLIGNLMNLRILYLDGNNLSGRVPTSLGQASKLGKLLLPPLYGHRILNLSH